MSLWSWLFGKPERPKGAKWRELCKQIKAENIAEHGRLTCERCLGHAKAWFRPRRTVFHVDHVQAFSRRPDLADSKGNLIVLCSKCNVSKGAKWGPDWRTLNRLGLLGLPFRLVVMVYQAFTPARYS